MKSLRTQLALFWTILLIVCLALALVMTLLFRSSAGREIDAAQAAAEGACAAIAGRYAKSLADPQRAAPQLDLLQVVLQLVLVETPHVEGGVWNASDGFIAYAYPTYEGSSVKRDVPEAERAHIAEVAQVSARQRAPETDVVRASREALVVSACPLVAPRHDLAAWTMTRTPLGMLEAQRSLRVGLGALLAFVLASGVWLGAILVRGHGRMRRLEAQLSRADADGEGEPFVPTGLRELDRLVDGLNRHRERLAAARSELRDAERRRSHDQRLASLGRMTGGIAHEIRNPIAAMRLKAENALVGPAERQPQALQAILSQIERLDGLVQSLLAVVQPLKLQRSPIDLAAWAAERAAGLRERAGARRVSLHVEADPGCVLADPAHLARAVDNLLDNAIRHAPEGGHVSLAMRRNDRGRLAIRVDDDGPGVAAELTDHLFEPFATGRPDGTGLGLALAREVAWAHDGELTYAARPGGGARFEMELPWRAC